MEFYTSCKEAIAGCLENRKYTIARLNSSEKTLEPHMQDCYEVYYSISGARQFLIDNKLYDISPGDVFFINQYELHNLIRVDDQQHERIVCNIFPEYLEKLSTENTVLDGAFTKREPGHTHRIHLDPNAKFRFEYLIGEMEKAKGYGQDIKEDLAFTSLMLFLSEQYIKQQKAGQNEKASLRHNPLADDILGYIDDNLSEPILLKNLAERFYVSEPYMCRVFKESTGTTINKYIVSKRVIKAMQLIQNGQDPAQACMNSGFNDYSNFYRSFKNITGFSPRQYAKSAAKSGCTQDTAAEKSD